MSCVCLVSERMPAAVRRLSELDLRIHSSKTHLVESTGPSAHRGGGSVDWYRLSCLDRTISGWLVYAMALAEAMSDQAVRRC